MNSRKAILGVGVWVSAILTGCGNLPMNTPLLFAENISVGINIGASTTDQGADVSVGFKSRDVAIVPVVSFESRDGNATAKAIPIRGSAKDCHGKKTSAKNNDGTTSKFCDGEATDNQDAYSVLGQFSSSTDAAGRRIGLGKFFATGQAALHLASGFEQCLTNGGCGLDAKASNESKSNPPSSAASDKTTPTTPTDATPCTTN